MRRPGITLAALAAVATFGTTLVAQKTTQVHPGQGGSPHVKSEWTIDGAHISITYGRPSLKGRSESEMMPPGKPWRMGADEATILTRDKALKFGTVSLAPGSYTLNAEPGASGWTLLVGKLGPKGEAQWGIPYDPKLEMGKAPMKAGKTKAPVEQLTISIDDTQTGGTLRVEWGTTSASIPFTVG
jgi:hypothetical protein